MGDVQRSSKTKVRPLVDERSYELAAHFLQSEIHTKDDLWNLADDIQRSVEDWFAHREMLREAAKKFRHRRALICAVADETDFMIMRWAQRNPRVCCSNYATGEPIAFGGRKQT